MDNNAQLLDDPVAHSAEYQMGRVVATLAEQTRAIGSLAKSIERHTEVVESHSIRLERIESGLAHANEDIRAIRRDAITLSSLGYIDTPTLRAHLQHAAHSHARHQDRQQLFRHVRNVALAALCVGAMWWCWDAMVTRAAHDIQTAGDKR